MTITDKLAEQHIREYESRLKHLDGGLIDCITGLVFTQLHRKKLCQQVVEKLMGECSTRQKWTKKRSLHRVNEHFESIFNAVMCRTGDFQQPVKAQADNRSIPYNLYPHAAH